MLPSKHANSPISSSFISWDEIFKYHGLKTGDMKQNEFITLKVLKFSEVEKIRSFSTYVAYNLVKNNKLI